MREYAAQLPDYTRRIAMERFRRAKARGPLEWSDRWRLEVAYTGGQGTLFVVPPVERNSC